MKNIYVETKKTEPEAYIDLRLSCHIRFTGQA